MSAKQDLRRFVPSVDRMLRSPALQAALMRSPRWAVLEAVRTQLEAVRAGPAHPPAEDAREAWIDALAARAAARVDRVTEYSIQHVINATGVVLHTNLGRAPLAERAIRHVVETARRYTNLELDLESGERGSRYSHVEALVCELTGAEAAIVVNNNAAAVVLALTALADDREVIISRGELVEIGGSFRIPAILEESGARLVEVGTTNRTRLSDYESALTERTAMLLKVHASNYRMIGFTAEVSVAELVALARPRGLVVMHDLGSGCLLDLAAYGLPREPTVREVILEGADLVTFSGDKLLGGPQLGVIAGRREIVERLTRHQLLRALRVDKMTLAAFEATLRVYRDAPDPAAEIPALAMLAATRESLAIRAERIAARLAKDLPSASIAVIDGSSRAGGGSLPDAELPTALVAIEASGARSELLRAESGARASPERAPMASGARSEPLRAERLSLRLRRGRPPVLVRVFDDRVVIDPRTVFEDEEEALARRIVEAVEVTDDEA